MPKLERRIERKHTVGAFQVDPFGKFRKLGRGGKDPEASKGGALSTTTSSMSKVGTPSLKSSVTTSCQGRSNRD